MDNTTVSGSIKEKLTYLENPGSPYFDPSMNYYICSYGGSGSTVLYKYLSNFGKAYHIHSRYPPDKLKYTGSLFTTKNTRSEWFNDIDIPQEQLKYYKVIFIYRNPIHAIYSSFVNTEYEGFIGACREHIINVQASNTGEILLSDIVRTSRDLYGIENFYDNYLHQPFQKNYQIICVKYETLFENLPLLNDVLEIPDSESLYPIKKEKKRPTYSFQKLSQIYQPLLKKMEKMPPIEIR
jgi:hypothetical protein